MGRCLEPKLRKSILGGTEYRKKSLLNLTINCLTNYAQCNLISYSVRLTSISLSPLRHTALLHTFKLLAHPTFLDLALLLLLRVFEIALVT